MIAIGFAALAVLVLVLAWCLYACESKRAETRFALDTIDALYMGMCQANEELVKQLGVAVVNAEETLKALDWFEGAYQNAEAYCEMLEHSHNKLLEKIERLQQQR